MQGNTQLYFETLFTHPFQCILVLNLQGKVRRMNPLSTELGGDMVGTPFWQFGWWKGAQQVQQRIQQAVKKAAQGSAIEEQAPIPDQSGQSRMWRWVFAPVRNETGHVVDVMVSGLDINPPSFQTENETRYKKLVNNIPGTAFRFVMSTTGEFAFDFLGENCTGLVGYSSQEILHNPELLFNCIPAPDLKKVYSAIQVSAENLTPYKLEHRLTRKDGTTAWLYTSSVPHRHKDGTIVWDGIALDITSRKVDKARLMESEKKWRNILVNTPQIGISLDISGRITFANHSFLDLTGWKEKEILGQNWFDRFIPDQIKERVRQVFSDTMTRKSIQGFSQFENDIQTKSGELKKIAWSNVLTRDARGEIRDITCLGIDLTERIMAETALKESEAKYRSMMESMDEPAYICSSGFTIEYMNPAMIKKIGRDATGEACHLAIHNQEDQCSWCPHPRVMAGETVKTELAMENGAGTYFVSHSPIHHTDGSVSKLSIYRDVTEVKLLETRLQQSQKMESIGTLAGGIAHDFNNILFPILGQAELLIEDLPKASSEAESAREILKAGKRGRDLVGQILSFSRQSDKQPMPISIQRVLKEVLKLSRSTIPSNIEIIEDIQADCGRILGEPTQLHQVIMNLITNAFHAVAPIDGQIRVSLEEVHEHPFSHGTPYPETGRRARLVVADTGVGIPPELISKIYDPYFTTKKRGKGTGLGLATVYGIVKEFKGEIRVSSIPGEGTQFTLLFPILDQAEEMPRQTGSKKIRGGQERILLVDDEAAIVTLEKTILERAGYTVTPRTGSIEALEKFKADPWAFDLVITDMAMPNMTGDKLSRKILDLRPDIPIIICTGFSEQIDKRMAAHAGIKGFLKKPLVAAQLMQTIRELLDTSG